MRVRVISCGPFANESERKAVEHLKNRLQMEEGDDEWILLTNLAFSFTPQFQSDEIDIVAIGPPGVRVIEVKHWTSEWARDRQREVEQAADLVTIKSRKVGTSLRRHRPELPHVSGSLLLTQEAAKLKRLAGQIVRGVGFHPLGAWKAAIGLDGSRVLSGIEIRRLSHLLEPRSAVALDGSLRRLAGYVNLELCSPRDERFHRVYRGSHPARRDRVILHLYDLSTDEKNAAAKARREFEALRRLQHFLWAPRLLDSFQDAPGYPGEMSFFTIVDPAAPSLAERNEDTCWAPARRVAFARAALQALAELHAVEVDGQPLVHRNLTPGTILVKFDDTPLLTGFDRSRIPSDVSVASAGPPDLGDGGDLAPEVRAHGLAAADVRSDVYAICSALAVLFPEEADELSRRARAILEGGRHAEPERRGRPDELKAALSGLLGLSAPGPEAPPARYWTEGQLIRFRDRDYRILNHLGSGGVGTTFKVVERDRATGEDLGTYVAKAAHDGAIGQRVLRSYSLARSHLGGHPGLSTIFEVVREWRDNELVALMTWVEGSPLAEFTGVLSLLAEDLQESSAAQLAVRWLRSACEALGVLHRNGLVHGDVSPRNLIVSAGGLVLTDYDFVGRIGEAAVGLGTILYAPQAPEGPHIASASDDIYALAASLFHVLYEREPFRHGGDLDKRRGLNWDGLDRDECPALAAFLSNATHPDPGRRFRSVAEAIVCLASPDRSSEPAGEPPAAGPGEVATMAPALPPAGPALREEHIPWVVELFRAYPRSPAGNRETRGLDSPFSESVYVPTTLEHSLECGIRERRTRLVILCGNAGDGKTALLQHLARELGLGKHPSTRRILHGRLSDGLQVRMNLDGSAAWQGRSADELVDEFLRPFRDGPPGEDIAHLLAINDGRLLEWVEGYPERHGGQQTALTEQLARHLDGEADPPRSHVRFISLNRRSLVGDVVAGASCIGTEFLDRLVDHLYGGASAAATWRPCLTCSAQGRCEIFRAAGRFGPAAVPFAAAEPARRRARDRLFEALQAVHLRGEVHITMRELRAALVYILFGLDACEDYHAGTADGPIPYWERAFRADSPARQGELLKELTRFDPAWDAHPQIDRHLSTWPLDDPPGTSPRFPELPLESARRKAYFEWTEAHSEQVAGEQAALGLARGRHLADFRSLPWATDTTRADVCRRLCGGISRLEDLPPRALDRPGVVPLRVTPRTPTETAFWVEKPLAAFRLEPDLPPPADGLERLHRRAALIYRYRDGQEERLDLGAELFHLLLELNDGYQLGDVSSDDAFANLSIFVQRLVQEDARELFAWNPMADEGVYRIAAERHAAGEGPQQILTLASLLSQDEG